MINIGSPGDQRTCSSSTATARTSLELRPSWNAHTRSASNGTWNNIASWESILPIVCAILIKVLSVTETKDFQSLSHISSSNKFGGQISRYKFYYFESITRSSCINILTIIEWFWTLWSLRWKSYNDNYFSIRMCWTQPSGQYYKLFCENLA